MEILGLLIGFLIIGPIFCWFIGMFNPMGYLLVPPWKVPKCTCGKEMYHDKGCPRYPS